MCKAHSDLDFLAEISIHSIHTVALSVKPSQGTGEDSGNGNLLLGNSIGPEKYMGNAVLKM